MKYINLSWTLSPGVWIYRIGIRVSYIQKVPMGFLIPWRNTCQPSSQTPSDMN